PTEAKEVRGRDDKGRFVSKAPEAPEPVAEEPAPQPEVEKPAPEPENEARVPSWRLAEEAERRRTAEQALNELRNEFRQMQSTLQRQNQPPPPEVPDIFADPNAFVSHLQTNFDNRLRDLRNEQSLRFAHLQHGKAFEDG